jgi:pimeloyl-ACP methyl ester carboxylesterase
VSEEVSFLADDRTVFGTIVHPEAPGPWPAVLMLAGSGAEDRDWNTKLGEGTNGSGALLAPELAKHGAVVLRFDNAGSGKTPGPPTGWTLDTYRTEALAGVALLRARSDVRRDRVFVVGHGEGGIHATRLAQVVQPAGIIYLTAASRPMTETLLAQLERYLRGPYAQLSEAAIAQELDGLRHALADFIAGKPVDVTQASHIPGVQAFLDQAFAPSTAGVFRGLLAFDNAVEAAKLDGPFYIAAGGKDRRNDLELDARRLDKSLRAAGKDVTFHISPDADRVLKHEPRTLAEAREEDRENAAGRVLDKDFLDSLVAWLAMHAR